ncbi:hypothetical protein BGZ65_010493, partial [Modicella reniformis]
MDTPSATTAASTAASIGSMNNNGSTTASLHGSMPTITTTSADLTASIPSFAAARRARADTLPSRPSPFLQDSNGTHPSAFPLGNIPSSGVQRPLRRTPSLLVPPQLSTRHRSGSLTLPPASISAAFGPSIFTSSWGEPGSPGSDRPATTPTTREMLFDSDNENAIMSTLDALGLDDPVQSSGSASSGTGMASFASALSHLELGSSNRGSTSLGLNSMNNRSNSINSLSSITGINGMNGISNVNGMGGIKSNNNTASVGGGSVVNNSSSNANNSNGNSAMSMPDIRLEKSLAHSLLMSNSVSFANRIRSYSVSATPAYQEVLEDEHEDEIGHLTSSSLSSGSSGVYTGVGGVHQFQTFQQTHSRPRAISMGFLEIPHDVADEQRKFANAGPRSYSDMRARQTHQRTTSAGADMLSEIVSGHSAGVAGTGATSSAAAAPGNVSVDNKGVLTNGAGPSVIERGGISHGHSLSYSNQLHAQQQQQQQQQH